MVLERKLRRALDRAFQVVVAGQGILLLGMVLLVFGQVVVREVFQVGVHWLYELARFFQVSLVFLGVPVLVHRKGDVAISLLVDAVAPGYRRWFHLGTMVVIAFSSTIIVAGFFLYIRRFGSVLTPTLAMPSTLFFVAVPVGFFLNGVVLFHQILCWFSEGTGACPDEAAGAFTVDPRSEI